jgi:hypothetical protein
MRAHRTSNVHMVANVCQKVPKQFEKKAKESGELFHIRRDSDLWQAQEGGGVPPLRDTQKSTACLWRIHAIGRAHLESCVAQARVAQRLVPRARPDRNRMVSDRAPAPAPGTGLGASIGLLSAPQRAAIVKCDSLAHAVETPSATNDLRYHERQL